LFSGSARRAYGAAVPWGKEMLGKLKYFWTVGAARSASASVTVIAIPAPKSPHQKLSITTATSAPPRAKCQ
jgi:hypothetical protein